MRHLVVWAALIGLAARLAFGLGYWVGKPLTQDEQEYLTLASNLGEGRGFIYDPDGREHVGRAPLYPLFLAAVHRVTPGLTAIKVAQAALGTLLVVLVAGLARRASGERAAAVAALITAVYPPLVWMPAYVLSETLYSVLIAGAGLSLWRVMNDASKVSAATAGALAGAAALTRPIALAFIALTWAFLAFRRRMGLSMVFALAAVLVIAPWTLRNVKTHGRLVLIASEGGVTFWTGNHPLATGEGDMASNPAIKLANAQLRARHPGLTAEELEPIYYQEALQYIASEPGQWLRLLASKFVHIWLPIGRSYTGHSQRYFIASLVSYVPLLLLAIPGAIVLLAGQRSSIAPLWLLGCSVVLECLIFFPQERFRIPVLDPVLIVCASTLIARLVVRR